MPGAKLFSYLVAAQGEHLPAEFEILLSPDVGRDKRQFELCLKAFLVVYVRTNMRVCLCVRESVLAAHLILSGISISLCSDAWQ